MIAPLRRRHRRMTAALLVAVPVLYVAALAVRPAEPLLEELPAPLAERPAGAVTEELGELFAGHPITGRVRRSGAGWLLELEPRAPVVRPEVLLYWAPAGARTRELPRDAILLGALAGTRGRAFALPAAALGRAGRLFLYSLAHQKVVEAADLRAIGAAPVESGAAAGEGAERPAVEAGQ